MMLINRDYTRLWIGQAVSSIGDQLALTTVVLWIGTVLLAGDRYAPAAVAGLLVADAVTIMTVAPVAGVFVDRWDRRRVMLASDLARAVLFGALAVIAALPATRHSHGSLVVIYTVAVGAAVAGRFFYPARTAYTADVVTEPADRSRAAGIGQATDAFATIAGPPLAAPLLFALGPQYALAVNAVSFLLSFLAVRSIRVPGAVGEAGRAPAASGFRTELLAGFRFVARSRVLIVLLVTIVVTTLGTGAINALDVFFTTANLHVKPQYYGLLGMGLGLGVVAGSLGGGQLAARIGPARTLSIGLLEAGFGLFVYSRLSSFPLAVAVLTLTGLPIGMLGTAVGPLLLEATPRELLGRVSAVINPVQQLSNLISAVLAGWLVSTVLNGMHAHVAGFTFGPFDTVFMAGGLMVIAAGVYASVQVGRAIVPVTPAPVPEPAVPPDVPSPLPDDPSVPPQPQPDAGVGGQ